MVRLHSIPLHGLRTSRYRGDDAVCCPSGRLGIAPNIGSSVVKLLCRPSPVFPRFRANGSHRSVNTQGPQITLLWHVRLSGHSCFLNSLENHRVNAKKMMSFSLYPQRLEAPALSVLREP